MNNRGLLGSLVLIGILFIFGFFWFVDNVNKNENIETHVNDSCAPSSCCHADSCSWMSGVLDCSDVICTLECQEGTMDCGQGKCEVVDGECEVSWEDEE